MFGPIRLTGRSDEQPMRRPKLAPYNVFMEETGEHTPNGPGSTTPGSPPRWSMGGSFVDALGRRDFDAMADCLDHGVKLRGLIPPGPFEATGPEEVMARFRRWFGGPDTLEIVDATVCDVGPKMYLRWRIAMTPCAAGEPARLVEQHIYATIEQRIVGLDLLCSGFAPEPAPRRGAES
jgi:hypothetical protein